MTCPTHATGYVDERWGCLSCRIARTYEEPASSPETPDQVDGLMRMAGCYDLPDSHA